MNKTIFVLVPLCCLLAACASKAPPAPPAPSASFIPNCPEVPTARPCPGQRNEIRLVVSAVGIDPRPSVVCADKGATIEVTVVGIPANAVVATVPKDADNGWILSAITGEGKTSIVVPEDTPDGKYGYFAIASTGKCVDPIIHVN